MANTVSITTLLDGPKHAIVHVYLKCDGLEGEVVDHLIFDPATLFPPQNPVPKFVIEQIWHDLSGFGVRLEYNSIPDTPIWTCGEGESCHMDFREFGGLKDRSGLDGSGGLQITTFGFDNAIKQGTMVVKIRK